MRVRILLTNGTRTVDYVWIRHDGKDVYWGRVGDSDHWSYHEKGERHRREPGRPPMFVWQSAPLAEVKGIHQLAAYGVGVSVLDPRRRRQGLGRDYTGKKSDAILAIDLRAFPNEKQPVNILVGVMEPGNMQALTKLVGDPRVRIHQFMVATSVTPWVWAEVLVPTPEVER